ncbi:hypothetical protein O181_026707 [Austropuccinia psidii MF-1]|uniref:Uncharacterized protein n=1 Tax=Austropuccinia psidii MF-1 TaxID=1389203 RepID=A0A9Q3CR50_9BASI|nr:hypothetical protein [Austropuccinia psidii MF-1]
MPEPQRTDIGGTEGEDSVSSVSLELVTKGYASRRIQGVRLCTSSLKNHQVCGAITQLMAPQCPQCGAPRPDSSIQDLPFKYGVVHLIDCPGPLSMGPGHIAPTDHRDKKITLAPNGPKMGLDPKISRMVIDMARTQKHPYDPEWAQRPFLRPYLQGKWGKDPSLELWEEQNDNY